MIQSSAPRLPKIRSKADLQVQPMKFCFDEGFSMRAIARVFGAGLTLARVDKPLKEEAVGCQV